MLVRDVISGYMYSLTVVFSPLEIQNMLWIVICDTACSTLMVETLPVHACFPSLQELKSTCD